MAIIGGGPIGLECLLRAVREDWDAVLIEKGRVGESVRRWGFVRMFSPFGMNASEAAQEAAQTTAPTDTADWLLTGSEFVAHHLEPLAASPVLAGCVRTGAEVLGVSRDTLHKGDEIATPARGHVPFRILVRDGSVERIETADVVVDASGTFGSHNWLGPGGIPAPGEIAAAAGGSFGTGGGGVPAGIEYHLPDITGRDRARFAGRSTLVVGAGHSAATAIGWLGDLAGDTSGAGAGGTSVIWVTRSDARRPVPEIEGDPLAERERVTSIANDAAEAASGWLDREPGAGVVSVRPEGERIRAEIANGGIPRTILVDRVLALVGYRPDLALARELQVQTCWATEGTYPLAAALLSQSGGDADCLSAGAALDAATLRHPEAGFFTLGMKSYGRNPNFLIRTGLKQIDDLFDLLAKEAGA